MIDSIAKIGNPVLQLLWHIVHFFVNIWLYVLSIAYLLESYVASSGLLKRYKSLNLCNVRYLAIVVDSEEARQISEVVELLQWLESIGVKCVCLYDMEGVLKKSKKLIIEKLRNSTSLKVNGKTDRTLNESISLEFCSFSDGRVSVTKAANDMFSKYMELGSRDKECPLFTEPRMAKALRRVGYGAPDPDLLLIYGPARCHLGFPPWRLTYTELVHMGSLKSMIYGSIVKVIYNFTRVRQNYGK